MMTGDAAPMTRRQLGALLAGTAAAAAVGAGTGSAIAGGPDAKKPLWSGYGSALVVDGLSEAFDTDTPLTIDPETISACRNSGMSAINFTVVGPGAGFEQAVAAIAGVDRAVEIHPDVFLLVRRVEDIDRARRERRLGLILGFQTTDMIGAELPRMEIFRNLGVRVMQVTYNDRNLWGDGCLEAGNAGLSNAGRTAVEKMNALGVAVDLAHSGQRTTADAISVSKRPVLISHSGCNAIYRHPRNKDDAELRALAQKGGVVGIYLMPFLDGGTGELTAEMFLKHLDHAVLICGEDHVGIGSDQGIRPINDTPKYRSDLRLEVEDRRRRGVSAPGESPDRPPFIPEFNSERRMDRIAAALSRRGYSDGTIEKVLGANFRRVLSDIWDVS